MLTCSLLFPHIVFLLQVVILKGLSHLSFSMGGGAWMSWPYSSTTAMKGLLLAYRILCYVISIHLSIMHTTTILSFKACSAVIVKLPVIPKA